MFEGASVTPVQLRLFVPEHIKDVICVKIKEYGHLIGEKNDIIDTIIENLIDPSKGIQSNIEEYTRFIQDVGLPEIYTTAERSHC